MTITDQVKTYEDAVVIYREKYGPLPELNIPLHASKLTFASTEANDKLSIIYKVLNEGWEPDWEKNNQRKWLPCFYWWLSPFVFDGAYFGNWNVISAGSSCLCLENYELADHAGRTFTSLYEPLFCGIVYINQPHYNGRITQMRQHNKNKVEHGVKVIFNYK